MKCRSLTLSGAVGVALLLYGPSPALAQTAPPLGVLQGFSVMAQSGVTGSAGAGTVVNGDVGSSPTNTIINFPPSSVTPPFIVHFANDGVVQQARIDSIAAFNFLGAPQGAGTPIPDALAGQTLTPGVYNLGAALLSGPGVLILNDPTGTGIFVFRTSSSLTTTNTSNVTGTANPCNVYWQIGSSATIDSVNFFGNVIADASITVTGNLTGRAIAGTGPTGAVTMAVGGNTIGGCASGGGVPALPHGMEWGLLVILLGTGAYILNRR